MSQELVKVIVEISGGAVQAIYCGADGRPLADVVVVDHDSDSVEEMSTHGLAAFDAKDAEGYERSGDVAWACPASVTTIESR